jgi:hypothetical protein
MADVSDPIHRPDHQHNGFRGEGRELREGHLRYTRWPIVGLTFQLAADNIETGIVPTRDGIERQPAPQSSGRGAHKAPEDQAHMIAGVRKAGLPVPTDASALSP